MPKNKSTVTTETDDVPRKFYDGDVTDSTDSLLASALASAWSGIYHFFGGRVESWEVLPISDENPDGAIVAHGFSVDGDIGVDIDCERILRDISTRNRRVEFLPFYHFISDPSIVPTGFGTPLEMQGWLVQFMKGSIEDGTARTPEYARQAVADYKGAAGLATRRGPKRKIVRLDELETLDENTIRNIPKSDLEAFLRKAQMVLDSSPVEVTSNDEVAVSA